MAEAHITMTLMKYRNKIERKKRIEITNPELNGFLKITALLENKRQKRIFSRIKDKSKWSGLSHVKMINISNIATGLQSWMMFYT